MSNAQETTRSGSQDDHRPLTEKEKTQVVRLLSDPFSFPMAFKTWHVRSLEISDVSLQMTNVLGLTKTLGIDGKGTGAVSLLNTGCVVLFAGTVIPPKSLLCNGGAYATTAYPELFAAIGYVHGGSGGSFNVPNIPAPAGCKYVIVT